MGVIGVFIILAIVVYFFSFSKGNNEDIEKIKKQGGIEIKFLELIGYFYSIDRSMQISSRGDKFISISGKINFTHKTDFTLHYNFSKVIIIWRFETPVFGTITEKFEFPDYYNQDLMIEEIDLRIGNVLKQYTDYLKKNT